MVKTYEKLDVSGSIDFTHKTEVICEFVTPNSIYTSLSCLLRTPMVRQNEVILAVLREAAKNENSSYNSGKYSSRAHNWSVDAFLMFLTDYEQKQFF